MNALVVYESIYGNTRAVAEAVAEGLGGASVAPVASAPAQLENLDLLVVGGPTHMHGLATNRSRQMAAEGAHEDKGTHVEADAADGPGLRSWLADLPDGQGARAASFDTRLDKSAWVTGLASRGIAKRLRRDGYDIVATESFLVEDSEGPLEDGELDRARAWGEQLAGKPPATAASSAAQESSASTLA
jgi:flavodoxin